jgi:hypothetical protein
VAFQIVALTIDADDNVIERRIVPRPYGALYPKKMKNEVSRCCDGKHAEQRGQHSNEIANVLHFPLPVEGASR